jgi:hypothetical protein
MLKPTFKYFKTITEFNYIRNTIVWDMVHNLIMPFTNILNMTNA